MPRLVAINIVHLLHGVRGERPQGSDVFDDQYGVDTTAAVEASALQTDSPNFRYAKRYEASSATATRRAIDGLGIDPKEFAFIDFGSGKGRILLVASTYPFKEVIGIEFARDLHKVSLANIARFSGKIAPVKAVHADAAEFEPPQTDLVCFFGNPFGPPVIHQVAQRLAAHAVRHRVFIVYYQPVHADAFDHTGGFETLKSEPVMLVLRSRPS